MLGEAQMREITQAVLAGSSADQTEVLVLHEDSQLTRVANSEIHQNVAERNTQVMVRVVIGRRLGRASANDLRPESLAGLAEQALAAARVQSENPHFRSLPEPQPVARVNAWFERTASFTPEDRAVAMEVLCRKAHEAGTVASGAFTTGHYEMAVANSLGIWAYHPYTYADLEAVVMADSGSGHAHFVSGDVSELDVEALADEVVSTAVRSRNPRDFTPGEYPVVLAEQAVIDLVQWFAYQAFGALAVQEGRSPFCGRFGQQVLDPRVSLWDDGLDPSGVPLPFDGEGVPRQRLELIRDGVPTGVAYDSYTAGKEGKASTGHALPVVEAGQASAGPLPLHWFMAPGDLPRDELLAGVDRGVWVSRFWYTRLVRPSDLTVTGMTRDGTFWIEGGEIAYPVRNLRFTQSYVAALNAVDRIAAQTVLKAGPFFGHGRVPALRLHAFNFTGVTLGT